MNSNEVERFGVIIFESLNDNEKKTGYNLYNTTLKYKQFEDNVLHLEYYNIENREDFFKVLNRIVDEAIENNYFYFLHFEIHGYDGGINLKNDEDVEWKEIIPIIRKLNFHYKNTLGLYLAVCKGATIMNNTDFNDRAPFGFIVANTDDLNQDEILLGFEKFYESFFFNLDAKVAVEEFNKVVRNEINELEHITSKHLIDMVCDVERPNANREKLFDTIKKHLGTKIPYFQNLTTEQQNIILEIELEKISDECKSLKSHFLMHDLK